MLIEERGFMVRKSILIFFATQYLQMNNPKARDCFLFSKGMERGDLSEHL